MNNDDMWELLLQASDTQIRTDVMETLIKPAVSNEMKVEALKKLDQMDNTIISSFVKRIIPPLLSIYTKEKSNTLTKEEFDAWKIVV